MFRSIRKGITNTLIQDNAICYVLGFIIGIGGFAEATLVGMGVYTLSVFVKQTRSHNPLVWTKDVAVAAIGLLLFVYWSYVDHYSLIKFTPPLFCGINSNESLSLAEALKIICLVIFGISCNHSPLNMTRKLFCGVAIGLSIYVIPTVLGSIAMQGIRGGGDKIFNIFSGNITAQSTTAGYIVIMMIGILSALKKRKLLIVTIALAFATGIQTSNRSVLVFGVMSCIIESLSRLKSQRASESHKLQSINKKKRLYLYGSLAMAALTLIGSSQFIRSRVTAAIDGRLGLYIQGYGNLMDYLRNPTDNLLKDAVWQFWWHSVPLDATRAGNLSGAYLSLAWLTILIIGIALCIKKRDLHLLQLNFALLFIYMTGMPLAAGAYELIALFCGYLLLSNELVPSGQT